MANKRNRAPRSKRKFLGNQFCKKRGRIKDKSARSARPNSPNNTPQSGDKRKVVGDSTPLSRSAKKIKLGDEEMLQKDDFFWFFLHSNIFENLLTLIGRCPNCTSGGLSISHNERKRMGYALNFQLSCNKCQWKHELYTSPTIDNDSTPGLNSFCINVQTVLAFREIGKGHEPLKTFNSCMNMPQPMTAKSFAAVNEKLSIAYEEVAKRCMQGAAEEVRKTPLTTEDAEIEDCQVAIDGTWQKRGYASLNGVIVATSVEGKVLDYQVLSKTCKGCQVWSSRQGTQEYDRWKEKHKCKINHKKSAGAMEAVGAVNIFHQSVDKYKLRYMKYIGDGDTESFGKVVKARPYGDLLPVKLECVGHVQKRLGTRLRKLRQNYKGEKLEDGRGIMGKGRLTDKCINTLQNYFGMAIRQNTSNVYLMKKSIGAVLYHCSAISDESVRHQFCPKSGDGWCKWQNDQLNKTKTYKKKVVMPLVIKRLIEPIFRDLSSDSLLKSCLHGQTQNSNEAFNGVLWTKCPKEVYVGRNTLQMASDSAVINYNEGFGRIKDVFKSLNLPVGKHFHIGARLKDRQRIIQSNRKATNEVKKQRKKLRAQRKGLLDNEKELEGGESYQTGSF